MAKSQRNLLLIVVPLAAALAWFALSDGGFSRPAESDGRAAKQNQSADLEQAAAAIAASAKEQIAATKSDDEAVRKALWSFEALQSIGMLGKIDTGQQAAEIFDAFRTDRRPGVVEVLVQMQLASSIRGWEQLTESARSAAIDAFVDEVNKTGLTRAEAEFAIRMSEALDGEGESKLVKKAIQGILPVARSSSDPMLNRMATIYEGIVRRIDLVGKPIEIEGTLLDGQKFDWSDYRGKVVLIDFHASWCIPCRQEVPNILENYRAFRDKGFAIVGVNLDRDRAHAQLYSQQTGFNFPTIIGDSPTTSGWDLPMARKYGITAIPRVILVDQEGKVVSTVARGEKLGELLEQLLGASDKPPTRATGRIDDPSVSPGGQLPADKSVILPTSATEEAAPVEPAPEVTEAPEPPK